MPSSIISKTIAHFTSIFPNTPTPNATSLQSLLHNLTYNLAPPSQANTQATLNTMRGLIDDQEYKYQLSLDPFKEEGLAMFEECYEQCSTGLEKKETGFLSEEEGLLEEVWNWNEKQGQRRRQAEEDYLMFMD